MSQQGRWPGTWRVICDVCGFEFPSDKVQKRWDGLIVCEKDFEHKHPQLSIRARRETSGVPFARVDPEDDFLYVCDAWSSSPLVGFGEVGCSTIGGYSNIEGLIEMFSPTCIAGIAITGRSIPGVI
jgi:predicted HicB family RNase H-like nuclease